MHKATAQDTFLHFLRILIAPPERLGLYFAIVGI